MRYIASGRAPPPDCRCVKRLDVGYHERNMGSSCKVERPLAEKIDTLLTSLFRGEGERLAGVLEILSFRCEQ